jgi:hypothetical protein
MSRVYKSARGKMVDMDKIKLSNETATAVGNMRVNARGDILGSGGQIAQGRNAVMDRAYAVESAPYSPNEPATHAQRQTAIQASSAKDLHDLANNLITPITNPEPPINQDTDAAPARGSLASSVAKSVTVTQEPLQDPRKPKGPSRI